jgi:DNA invertase Pin-like site-specific DNA recombinase
LTQTRIGASIFGHFPRIEFVPATPKKREKALAYLRTSSATNVGGDSPERQRAAIQAYAERNGIEVVGEFYDAAVSGADPVQGRPGFAAMLARIAGNGVRLVLVEDASRFARELIPQEMGVAMMQRLGVRVLTASGIDMTASDDPSRVLIRQMFGAVAEFEKATLVAKLRGARDRKSRDAGRRVEGRKPALSGEALAMAKRLHRKNPVTGKRRSLRQIAAALAEAGHFCPPTKKDLGTDIRRPFSAETLRLALAGKGTP